MKVKTLSEQVAPTCQTILWGNGCCGFQCRFHGRAGLFLDWHPLPTLPADPEVPWPFLRRGRQLPNLQCARRLVCCLWLVSTVLRVISSLIDSKFSVLPRAVLPAQESRTASSQEPRNFVPLCNCTCLDLPCYALRETGATFFSQCVEMSAHSHSRFVQLLRATHRERLDVHLGCWTWLTLAHGEHLAAEWQKSFVCRSISSPSFFLAESSEVTLCWWDLGLLLFCCAFKVHTAVWLF